MGKDGFMTKTKRTGRAVKISGFVWGAALLVTILFYLVRAALPEGVVYRVWLERTGAAWALFVLPLSLAVFLLSILWRGSIRTGRVSAAMVVTVVVLFVFMMYFMFAAVYTWVLDLSLGQESEFAEGILVTRTENTDSVPSQASYYEDMGIFVKKEYSPMSDIVLLAMEIKYGEKFVIAEESGKEDCYLVSPADNPEIVIRVQEMFGYFTDNYGEVQKN